ncbi:methyltransferase [Mangrovactinospora gilvigrisea]|uniref:Methyltransferase n=1 Tax=Mangrovactinospora gilvigrisea TaxID=1428644 RepID=A0A1J7C8G1_9ACTN|nr:ArsR family transcriptional regulator [Mangrovactinospora gilvigrisea]OIV35930.1 methyltransferase [Mangrovactinospora gilvigrisea]
MSEDQGTGWGGQLWAAADLLTPMAVRVAATLRLADRIAEGRRSAAELAEATGADPGALRRVLARLVTAGVLTGDDGAFGLTPTGEQLRDDHPDGMRAWLDQDGSVGRADLCFVRLLHTVRTGEPAFPEQYGRPFWEDLAADPARSAHFDDLMSARIAEDVPEVAAAYPFGELGSVVDVGGGDGTLLIAVLRAHPGLRGAVFDLPGPASRAERTLADAGLADRAESRAGSFLDGVEPAGAGGYLLSGVLHNWDDEDAARILRNCAAAAGDRGRILVVDHFDAAGSTGDPGSEGDLRMLCYFNGRERGLAELDAVAAAAGLRVGPVTPAGFRSFVELVPRRDVRPGG